MAVAREINTASKASIPNLLKAKGLGSFVVSNLTTDADTFHDTFPEKPMQAYVGRMHADLTVGRCTLKGVNMIVTDDFTGISDSLVEIYSTAGYIAEFKDYDELANLAVHRRPELKNVEPNLETYCTAVQPLFNGTLN